MSILTAKEAYEIYTSAKRVPEDVDDPPLTDLVISCMTQPMNTRHGL